MGHPEPRGCCRDVGQSGEGRVGEWMDGWVLVVGRWVGVKLGDEWRMPPSREQPVCDLDDSRKEGVKARAGRAAWAALRKLAAGWS